MQPLKRLHYAAGATLLAMSLAVSGAQAEPPKTMEAGKLNVALNGDMPMTGLDDDGKLIGTDGSLMVMIAERLGLEVVPHMMDWSAEIQSTKQGKVDIMHGAMGWIEPRTKIMLLTDPIYYFGTLATMKKENNWTTFEDMKGKRVAAAVGTVPEQEFLKYAKAWGTMDLYQGYQSENEVFLAVAQGKADAGITTNTAVKPIADKYDTIIAGPRMPWTTDFTSVVGPRKDFGWLNYLNLFVTHQVRSGRYQELWGQFVGGEAPELRIPGVMY